MTNILNKIRSRQTSVASKRLQDMLDDLRNPPNRLSKIRQDLKRREWVEPLLEDVFEGLDRWPSEPPKVPSVEDQYRVYEDSYGKISVNVYGSTVIDDRYQEEHQIFIKGRGEKIPYEEERTILIKLKDDNIRRQPLVIADYFFDKADRVGKIRGTNQQDEIMEIMEGKKPIPKGIKQKHIDNAHKIAQLYPEIWLTTNLAKGKISPFRRDMVRLCDAFPSMDTFTKLDIIGLSKLPGWYHLWDKPVYDAHDAIQHLKTLKHGFNNTTCILKYINQAQLETSGSRLTRLHFHTEYNELIELELGGGLDVLIRMLDSSFKDKTFKVVNPTIIKHDRQVPFVSVIGKITNFENFIAE